MLLSPKINCHKTVHEDENVKINSHKEVGLHYLNLSRVVRKPAFSLCKNKDADQLRSNREADQHLCFCHMDSAIPLLSKFEFSSL